MLLSFCCYLLVVHGTLVENGKNDPKNKNTQKIQAKWPTAAGRAV